LFATFFEFYLGLTISVLAATVLVAATAYPLPQAAVRWPMIGMAVVLAGVSLVGILFDQLPDRRPKYRTVFESRNFYGVVSVMHRAIGDEDENYTFYSGHIAHGKQLADPARRHIPLTYYGEGSGCELAVKYVQQRSPQCKIGIVGLGVGTIATYGRAGDSLRMYEINPEVIKIAQDTRWFHFLSDCPSQKEVVLGDARLQLERELKANGSHQFDLLIIDAFSGDAVPTHLLTREAFDVYLKHLAPNGMLALHITNTHLDLYPVVSKLADHYGYSHRRIYKPGDDDKLLQRTYYMLITNDQQFLTQTPNKIDDLPDYLRREREVPMWTDDYTNLTSLLR
jgi:hypothetical protein